MAVQGGKSEGAFVVMCMDDICITISCVKSRDG
jgi:hypothetical protein